MNTNDETQPAISKKRDEQLSSYGKWRSFPKVPNLLQYVSNGNYYGRIKVHGKLIRQSLETEVWSTAKLRLMDFLKKQQASGRRFQAPKFSEAVDLYRKDLDANTQMKPRSKEYRIGCIHKLQLTWPALWEQPLDEIRPQECKDWATKLNEGTTGDGQTRPNFAGDPEP